jgi:hypothetical protein
MKKTVSLTEVQLKDIINRVVSEQMAQAASAAIKQSTAATKPVPPGAGGRPSFNPTHIGGYEIDCKTKAVKLTVKGVVLKPEAKALLVDVFCNPKYRGTATPAPVAKQTGVTPTPAAKQTAPTSTPSSTGSPSDYYGNQ